ncbi:MAG: hypothetical protein ACLFM7_07270 [Bacteroidales bacterium]
MDGYGCTNNKIKRPIRVSGAFPAPAKPLQAARVLACNGICLSALYDKAFDKSLIGLNGNYEILLSDELRKKREKDYYPGKDFLKYLGDVLFRG